MAILDLLEGLVLALWPFLALAALILLVGGIVLNVIGSRLDRHGDLMRLLELRVANLHEERRQRHVQSLQVLREPPPLADAKTIEIGEELLLTLKKDPRSKREGPS